MSIRTERYQHVLKITINRPEAHNALSLAMGQELCTIWEEFRDDPDLRVAVLTGSGSKSFCAGADLKEVGSHYAAMTPLQRREHGERAPGLGGITRNLDAGKPIIAAINGYCLAGGLEIALACDVRLAVPHARFGLPEVTWGLIPGAGGTQRLPRAVPMALAMEMLLSGQQIDAERALVAGLINRIIPAEDLGAEALELAAKIAANGPIAVRAVRAAAREGAHLPLAEGLRLEQFYAEPARQSEDVREGLKAFAEKRTPIFKGS
ncbi:MAG: crotonase/enoyl-CoA hydratase family protein [Hyphomicrobiales bacterium]|nr:crotonase/enoyl-CoA hydratase family protein [Hyphomicrobiales bacterium]MCP5073542.1 crotonase/enoyl-CoA hydratase family protein [Paracoccaceae bacterium]